MSEVFTDIENTATVSDNVNDCESRLQLMSLGINLRTCWKKGHITGWIVTKYNCFMYMQPYD
jgi:hypothetical protein